MLTTTDSVNLNVKDKKFEFNSRHFSRWLCLVEAIEVIENNAKRNKINLERTDRWIKPGAITKYIDEREASMIKDVEYNEKLVPMEAC